MTHEEGREQAILGLADLMRTTHFTVEFKVKKKPTGIKVIVDVTKEQMDKVMEQAKERFKDGN